MTLSKRNLKIAGIAVAVVVVILIALPLFINVNSFRPKIESEATNALGRPLKLGNMSLSILTGTVAVDDLSIADDRAFSKSPGLEAAPAVAFPFQFRERHRTRASFRTYRAWLAVSRKVRCRTL